MVLLGLVMELQCILLILLTKLQKNPLLSKLAKLLILLNKLVLVNLAHYNIVIDYDIFIHNLCFLLELWRWRR